MAKVDAGWSSADLAKAVCDELVAKGLLKEKPAFIRSVAALRPPRAPAGQLLHAAPGICPCESGGATDSRAGSRACPPPQRETARRSFEQVFKAAKLDGASMAKMNGRGVEVAGAATATQGEGWVDDLQKVGPPPEGPRGVRVRVRGR